MNRALRTATTVALLVSPVVLSACSAGQVNQTSTQERDKTGAMAQVGDITIRQAQFLSPAEGTFARGDDADLQLTIVNSGTEEDTLVDITGEGFGDVEFDDGSTTGAAGGSSSSRGLEIPSDSPVFVDGDELTITLTDLDEELATGQYLDLTLVFEKAGEIDLPVTVATPDEVVERGEAFDFHEGEEGAEGAARERESREGQ